MVHQPAGGLIPVVSAQLASCTIAIGVDRGFRHPKLAGDLLRAEMAINQPQAFALPLG